jgi:hypothetical protein
MQSVTLGTLSLLVALFPFGLLIAALKISNWRQHVRLAEIARQIAVTDAIHAELGAVVSPVVRRKLRRGWRLSIPVPHDRPDTVMQVLRAAHRAFSTAERTSPRHFEIVLTPQEQPVPRRIPMTVPAATPRGRSVSWT